MSDKKIKEKTLPKLKKRKACTPEQIAANRHIYDDHFRMGFVRQFNREIYSLMDQNYFRPEFIGFEELPERNRPEHPIIFASNHSGMAFPWDGMIFGSGLSKMHEFDPKKQLRVLTAPMLSQTPAMHPYFMLHAWKMAGGIDASFLNFETMMHYPDGQLLIYPEGVPGIGKGFNRRYKLQRFSSSFIRMSLKYKTDIVWYSTINAEYVAPLMYSHKGVNKAINKIGVPFLPLGPLTPLLLFPAAFFLSFPSKMTFVRGSRIRPYEWTDKAFEELTEAEIEDIRQRVQDKCQEELDLALAQYGRKPYHLGELLRVIFRGFPLNTPLGWPMLFHEFEKQWHQKGKKGEEVKVYKGFGASIYLLFRNPICFLYFIPFFGWLALVAYGRWRWKNGFKDKE